MARRSMVWSEAAGAWSTRTSRKISEVFWNGIGFKAGLAPGMTIVAVDGKAYTHARLKAALLATRADTSRPIELLVRHADTFQLLTAILEPRVRPALLKN